jgi:hypothetical protein
VDDASFAYFVTHIHKLTPITLIMIAVGSALAYWPASGNTHSARHEDPPRSTEA